MNTFVDDVNEGSNLLRRPSMEEQGQPEPQTYPDGGRKAWMVVFGCFCAFLPALSMLNSLGTYQAWLANHQLSDDSTAKIGWIFSFYSFFSFSAGLFIGPLFDSMSVRPLLTAGGILTLLTYILLGLCHSYYQFFLCIGVLGGLGTCSLFTAAVGTIQHWFLKHRGLATGLAISGGSIGGITFPIILGALLPQFGFAHTTRIIAAIMLPFLIVSIVLMESPFSNISEGTRFKVPLPRLSILLKPKMAIMTTGLLLSELGIFIPVSYLTTYALAQGMSFELSNRMLTYLNIGSLLGRWFPGFIADNIGVFNMHILAMSFCCISTLGIWFPTGKSTILLSAYSVCFGFGSGCGIALVPVCIAQLCEIEAFGRVYSALHTVSSFGYVFMIGIVLCLS